MIEHRKKTSGRIFQPCHSGTVPEQQSLFRVPYYYQEKLTAGGQRNWNEDGSPTSTETLRAGNTGKVVRRTDEGCGRAATGEARRVADECSIPQSSRKHLQESDRAYAIVLYLATARRAAAAWQTSNMSSVGVSFRSRKNR
ncbi:MAG TPA: hypothetical protein VFQ83_02280 [Candidatus Udaeobacter sp.]|nr:hypothetical protein [Candidatus Udaeobacter sp.]